MTRRDHSTPFRPSLSLGSLFALLTVLWLAGGVSRADMLGQVVVRATAWSLLAAGFLIAERPQVGSAKPVAALLAAAVLLAVIQLAPLPPAVWQALPGRSELAEAASASAQNQPWRPWSIVPGATINAASSLIVPACALFYMLGLRRSDHSWLLGLVLGLVVASVVVGLLQFSGALSGNPFTNVLPGTVTGTFANRNHFALFVAFGLLIAPAWAFFEGRRPGWRGAVAFGLVLLFFLMILATGSRAGLMLGAVGLVLGLTLAWPGIRRELDRAPRWAFPAFLAALAGLIGAFGLVSILAGRADSIERMFALDVRQDMRSRGLPVVLTMVRDYFPFGSGLGGFDPVFRMHEPLELLKPTYLNHAHNDFLEIVLDAGVFGAALLAAAVLWWGWASARAWRRVSQPRFMLSRIGSAMLLLILVASLFDYPARTPLIMAMTIIAAVWLSGRHALALPGRDQHL